VCAHVYVTHTRAHRGYKSWYCAMILRGDLFSFFVMVTADILVTFLLQVVSKY